MEKKKSSLFTAMVFLWWDGRRSKERRKVDWTVEQEQSSGLLYSCFNLEKMLRFLDGLFYKFFWYYHSEQDFGERKVYNRGTVKHCDDQILCVPSFLLKIGYCTGMVNKYQFKKW